MPVPTFDWVQTTLTDSAESHEVIVEPALLLEKQVEMVLIIGLKPSI